MSISCNVAQSLSDIGEIVELFVSEFAHVHNVYIFYMYHCFVCFYVFIEGHLGS